jgi:hypothetical protein
VADREVVVRLRADISQYQRQLATAAAETQAFGRSTDKMNGPLSRTETQASSTGKEIDKLSGRLRLATDAALILGPALVPLGAAAVGGVVALSAELGAMAGALGVTLLAVNGLGDGLKALDAYQLNPTAENLAKLNEQMEKLGPSGEHFVRFLDGLEPDLKSLQMAARDGLFPGAEEGIDSLLQRLPELRSLVSGIAGELGKLSADAGASLGGPKFDAFFEYLRTDGIKILDDTSRTLGNLAEAAANTFAAFGGLSSDFSGGLLKFSQGLADATANLDSNAGFIKFVDYIETEGPHALDTLGSIGNAFLQIVEATAPLGGPVLTVLGKFADIIASIADSDLGTPIFAGLAALALLNRALVLTASLQSASFGGPAVALLKNYAAELSAVRAAQQASTTATQVELSQWDQLAAARRQSTTALAEEEKVGKSRAATIGKGAALIGGLALASSGLAEQTGLSNTASLALIGTIAGPWGAAIGGGVGLAIDLAHANDDLEAAVTRANAAMSATPDEQKAASDALHKQIDETNRAMGSFSPGGGHDGPLGQIKDAWTSLGNILGGGTDDARLAAEALDNVRNGIPTLTNPMAGLAASIGDVTAAAQEETDALNASVDAMRAKRQEALRALDAELNYQAAIDDANKAIKDNGKQFDITTEKGRANRQALYELADGWNQQSKAAKNAKGSLEDARKNFISTAEQMGATAGQAKNLADRLFEIPPKRKTQIELDGADDAISKVQTLSQILGSLHSKDIYVALHYQTIGNRGPTGGAPLPGVPNADGGSVPKDGGPYSDRFLYMLAPGEEVISNRHGQADRYRATIKGRMADGGTAGSTHTSRTASGLYATGGPFHAVNEAAGGAAHGLKALKAALDAASKTIDKEKQKRDDLIAAESSFMQAVGGAYAKADLFSGGLSDFDTGLAANTNDTQAAQAALAAAAANGLNGPLYQALAASGNLSLVQQFAGLSAAEIDQREQQFGAQSNAQAALGSSAATAAGFTQAIKDQNKELREAQRERKALNATIKDLQQRLPDSVEDGARKGIAERDRRTHHKVRTG